MCAFVSHPIPLFRHRHPSTSRSICPPRRRPLQCTATASNPADSSTSKKDQPSEFHNRFDDLRGKPVEPVAATVARFNSSFARPVPVVYRSVINEMLTTTHLAVVCAMWRFDAIFAYGMNQIFSELLRYYPDADERDDLFKCAVQALQLDYKTIRDNADAVAEWLEGKTEDDVLGGVDAAPSSPSVDSVGPVIEALTYVRDAGTFDWYYSRLFGIGLIQVMEKVGVELSVTNAETWAERIGLEKSKFGSEMGNYLSSMERLKQAEQIFAEATAREAKKTAERLAARAEAAAREAEKLEMGEGEAKVEDPSASSPQSS